MNQCPCCSQKNYAECCELFINEKKIPQTPEQLMRSRYTAFTQANMDYLIRTMKSPAADHFDVDDAKKWAQGVTWLKLEILNAAAKNDEGFIEFIAHFSHHDQQQQLHELSKFRRENDRWYYIDGKAPQKASASKKIGRNESCHCGSGKKYKKCCGK